jgi:arylsulfatase
VLDDVGFAQLRSFGSDISTPHLDRLARGGLRYNRFHVTALCSPSRACFLTGRNHHAVGMGFLADIPLAYPGYTARLPRSAAALPRLLRPRDGYHLSEDLASTAIRFLADQQQAAPGKPFFLYFALGAAHSPHHVAAAWADPYCGQFDQGWDAWRQEVFRRQHLAG